MGGEFAAAAMLHAHTQVIAGQGGVAIEVLADLMAACSAAPHVVIVPVGGGGLISGGFLLFKGFCPM